MPDTAHVQLFGRSEQPLSPPRRTSQLMVILRFYRLLCIVAWANPHLIFSVRAVVCGRCEPDSVYYFDHVFFVPLASEAMEYSRLFARK